MSDEGVHPGVAIHSHTLGPILELSGPIHQRVGGSKTVKISEFRVQLRSKSPLDERMQITDTCLHGEGHTLSPIFSRSR